MNIVSNNNQILIIITLNPKRVSKSMLIMIKVLGNEDNVRWVGALSL